MGKLLFICGGGAGGALLRYLVSGFVYRHVSGVFPWGTLVVNLIGSFAIGFLWVAFDSIVSLEGSRDLLLTGMLGAFTTFSTFNLENFHLLRDGEYGMTLVNVGLSNGAGIAFVFVGFLACRLILLRHY